MDIKTLIQPLANMAPATGLLDLPNEIQLRVLSFLPAKQIQLGRRINQHFRNIIDNPANRTLLITPGKNRSLARIRQDVEYFCDTKKEADLLECLSRVISRLGLPDARDQEISADESALPCWVADFYLSRNPSFQNATPLLKIDVEDRVRAIIARMVYVHVQNHVPQKWVLLPPPDLQHLPPVRGFSPPRFQNPLHNPRPEMTLEHFKSGLDMLLLEPYGIDEALMEKWFRELVDTPNGRLQGPVYHYPLNNVPEFPPDEQILTRIVVFATAGEAPNEATYGPRAILRAGQIGGEFRSDYLRATLGLPSIRDEGWGPPFGYCVQPGWSVEKMRVVLEGKIQSEIGVPSELAKAALLEDIYLY